MSAERPRTDEIFNAAAELTDASERQAFLNEACADDPQMLNEIDDLLKRDVEAGSFLESPPPGLGAAISQRITEKPGTIIGRYKLIERIGEGGMGLVYMAEQLEPVRRKVALKVLRAGLDTEQVVYRFEAERQALAIMNHPHIAKVLDAGTTEAGRPYFVMELVRGIPINEFCNKQRLDIRQRLELFATVCRAVQHAHQKGIIHRDLKPGNVLVELHDVTAVPKVIDFGVAKAIDHRLSEHSYYTNFSQMIGTPLYMSPEQAQLSGLDVDTRSDIYSLGVLLYELLTGTTPFEKVVLKEASYDELRRIICEDEPAKPSARVSTLKAERISTVSGNHNADPRRLSLQLQGEVDWIIMKAMDKDRTLRYETANELAADVDRYLNDLPVLASPPSAIYKFRKFARRNKGALSAGILIAASLLIGTGISTWQAIRANQQASRASMAEQNALAEADEAKRANEIADAVQQFFNDDILLQASPDKQKRGITLIEVLDLAVEKVGTRFADKPLVEAEIRETLARAFSGLGEFKKSIIHAERSKVLREKHLDKNAPKTLSAATRLAWLRLNVNNLDRHVTVLEGLVASCEQELGTGHEVTRWAVSKLGIGYRRQRKSDLAAERFQWLIDHSPDDEQAINAIKCLGIVKADQGQNVESRRLLENAYARGRELFDDQHHLVVSIRSTLATLYRSEGDFEKALPILQQIWEWQTENLGPGDSQTLTTQSNLARAMTDHAIWLAQSGHFEKADECKEEAAALHEEVANFQETRFWQNPMNVVNETDLIRSLALLRILYVSMKKENEKLLAVVEKNLNVTQHIAKLRPDDLDNRVEVAGSLSNYGACLIRKTKADDIYKPNLDDVQEALRYFERAKKHLIEVLSIEPDHVAALKYLMIVQTNSYESYALQGNYKKAVEGLEQLEKGNNFFRWRDAAWIYCWCSRLASTDRQMSIESRDKLANDYQDRAMNCLEQWTKNSIPLSAVDNERITNDELFKQLSHRGDFQALVTRINSKTLERMKTKLGEDHLNTLNCMGHLGEVYRKLGQFDKALPLLEQRQEIATAKLGVDHPTTLFFMNHLAWVYKDAGQPEKSLARFEKTFEIRKAKLGEDHPDTLDSMKNLGLAFQRQGQFDKALALLESAFELSKSKLGEDDEGRLGRMRALGYAYTLAGRFDKGLPLLESALELSKSKLGEDDQETRFRMKALANAYEKAGQFEKARPIWELKLESCKTNLGTNHGWTLNNMNELAAVYLQLSALDDAEKLLRECLAIREKNERPDRWRTFETKSLLGEALFGQQKFVEAEPLLLDGYQGLIRHKTLLPVTKSIERLVQLYESWHGIDPDGGYDDKATQWQTKLKEHEVRSPPTQQSTNK